MKKTVIISVAVLGVMVALFALSARKSSDPSSLIPNPDIEMGQPSSFEPEESWRNGELYIGATIFERDGRHLLRLISLLPDEGEETVKCIEASYRADGWYIENVEKFDNYYSDKLCRTLLKNNY